MSSDIPDPADVEAADVENVRVEDEMEQSYIDYAMSVIAGRALPDVRDGLKPVHRRILYAMHEMGVTSGSSHRKSSSIVGETMGDYHPHGDNPIYDTMVRMAPIAEELLADIGKDTVDFKPNYDDRLTEPEVLPAAFPNLLVNGSSGIAVGMSTKIPPHNLGEVVDATIKLIDEPDSSVSDLLAFGDGDDGPIRGPDFPTGAGIVGRGGIRKAYTTGRGRLRVRADYEIEHTERGRDSIVVTEIPYQQNKATLVERIAEDVTEGKIEGIADLRDESDRNGVRIVVEVKRGANTDVVENQLIEHHLERTFGVINLALVDGKPEVLTLKQTIQHYVDHRREVVRRRSEYDLAEAEDRAHILEGRLRALENVDDVVDLVRDSEDRDAAREALQGTFDFSERQSEHIVRMQLGSLTSMERTEIEEEYESVQAEIERLTTILESDEKLDEVIKEELRELKAEYDDERQTAILEDEGTVTHEDLIPEEDVLVVITEDDYIKRMPVDQFDPQRRGGKGIIGSDPKEGDRVSKVFRANTHDYCLCFTNHGQVYRLKTYEIPEMGRTARGKSAVNVIDLGDDEEITAVVTTDEFEDGECITMVTRDGYVKRTAAAEFENILSTGIIAADLEDGDELIDVQVTDGNQDLVIATADGMTIRFPEDEVRAMGRNARGVGGIRLEGDDRVVGLVATDEDDDCELLTVTESGYGKRTPLSEYRSQSRYGKGLVDIKTEERNGRVTSVKGVDEDDRLVVMSEDGQIMVTRVSEVSEQGRNTMGVIVMRVEGDDRVATVDVFPDADAADVDAADADDAETDDASDAAGADAAGADAAGADVADDE